MASKRIASIAFFAGALLAGCVSVKNRDGLVPPSALCSNLRGTVGVPKGPIPVDNLKSARTDAAIHLHEWVFSGASAGLIDLAIQNALANGDLKKVHYADYEQTSYLGFVTVFNLTVYGE